MCGSSVRNPPAVSNANLVILCGSPDRAERTEDTPSLGYLKPRSHSLRLSDCSRFFDPASTGHQMVGRLLRPAHFPEINVVHAHSGRFEVNAKESFGERRIGKRENHAAVDGELQIVPESDQAQLCFSGRLAVPIAALQVYGTASYVRRCLAGRYATHAVGRSLSTDRATGNSRPGYPGRHGTRFRTCLAHRGRSLRSTSRNRWSHRTQTLETPPRRQGRECCRRPSSAGRQGRCAAASTRLVSIRSPSHWSKPSNVVARSKPSLVRCNRFGGGIRLCDVRSGPSSEKKFHNSHPRSSRHTRAA